jgi:leucyl-tRNA synthetase
LSEISKNISLEWPSVNSKYLKTNEVNIVIQINGKKRSLITSKIDLEEKELMTKIYEIDDIKKFLEKKKIIKTIFIKNKLINLIIK